MVIIGLGGYTKDILNDLLQQYNASDLLFFSEITNDSNEEFFKIKRLQVSLLLQDVVDHFEQKDKRFLVTVGNNNTRYSLVKKYTAMGGIPSSFVSGSANVNFQFSEVSQTNTIIMHSAMIAAGAVVEEGVIVSQYAYVGHEVVINKYAFLGGYSGISVGTVGEYSFIGLKTVILPGRTVGKNALVGAYSMVNKSIPDNVKAHGIPAKISGK